MADIENKNIALAKKAYIALNTVGGLKEAIPEKPPIRVGEQIAGQVNALLDEVREIFSIDKIFKESIAHMGLLRNAVFCHPERSEGSIRRRDSSSFGLRMT